MRTASAHTAIPACSASHSRVLPQNFDDPDPPRGLGRLPTPFEHLSHEAQGAVEPNDSIVAANIVFRPTSARRRLESFPAQLPEDAERSGAHDGETASIFSFLTIPRSSSDRSTSSTIFSMLMVRTWKGSLWARCPGCNR